ncbi:helix-turn-helix domain-containing protein [Paenibacillus tarimensis]|uniref:helix-turn-helix domain-containing protein n=1 Tax=Paenibacillus tarimensis TaxID=416012 RepID=UPI001F277663|nr:helix-turn-helix transcriptional regulator [Paenibacillus tarimensis]MCF2945446.1 helix-turn-helix domain-containing protein [Paenibacillus tarimensis]
MKLETAFGIVLKKYRQFSSLSQEELALRCDLDRTFISLLERGHRRPTLNTIFTIAASLKVRPTELIQEVEDIINENNRD